MLTTPAQSADLVADRWRSRWWSPTFYLPAPRALARLRRLFSLAGRDRLARRPARPRLEQQSELGRFLDPIADKLLVATTLFMLAVFHRFSACADVAGAGDPVREILVSGLREYLARMRVGMPVSRLAKWKTGIQMVAIGVLLVGDAGPACAAAARHRRGAAVVAAALTVITGYDYLRAGLIHINRPVPETPSIKTANPGNAA